MESVEFHQANGWALMANTSIITTSSNDIIIIIEILGVSEELVEIFSVSGLGHGSLSTNQSPVLIFYGHRR